jgi:hypothetical protein
MSAKCQTWIQEALKDPEIRNLIPKDVKIECNICNFKGAFDNSTRRIILCENNLPLRFLFNQVLKRYMHRIQNMKHPLTILVCLEHALKSELQSFLMNVLY